MEASQAVSLLRRMRHDFANHLQVISGYLDMGWEERMSDYIRSIIAGLNQERIIFEAVDADVALYLYEQLLMIKDMGIILVYEELDLQTVQLLMGKNEPVSSLAAMRDEIEAADGEDEPVVYLSIYEGEKSIDLLFSCGCWEEDTRKVCIFKE